MSKYEHSQHLHIGYYENGYDLEVIAYKKVDEPIWDVYIEEYESEGTKLFDYVKQNSIGEYVQGYGFKIFSIRDEETDDILYEKGASTLESWLAKHNLIEK